MNKKIQNVLFSILFFSTAAAQAQNVGINETGATPNGAAMLDVSATNKGILIPRLSRAQKFLIPTPPNGLLIYQTDDTVGFWYYEQNKWVPALRSITFGKGLSGGMVQGKGQVDISKPGVLAATYGNDKEYPILTVNEYGQITIAATKKFVDNDTTNEIQSLKLVKDSLYLSKNGGFVHFKGFWGTTGNSGLDASTNFLGTTNGIPLRFRVNNAWFGELNSSNDNISFGHRSNRNSTGYSNIAVGTDALNSNLGGYFNTCIGWQSMYDNNSGSYNAALGANALYNNTTGDYNVGIGYEPLSSNTSGSFNVALGYRSLYTNTSGTYNVGVGMYSLIYNVSGVMNTAAGYYALGANVYGHYNVGIGCYSMSANNLGVGNAFIGFAAGYYNTSGYYNQGLGYYAGYQNRTGYYNSSMGYLSGPNGTNYENTTSLGSNAISTASDMVRLGNSSVTSIGGYTSWSNLSDARFKENIEENVHGLDFILKLRPVTYNVNIHKINDFLGIGSDTIKWASKYDGEKIRWTGLIAQEVEKAAESVNYDFSGVDKPKNEKDHYGLRYGQFVVPLIKAIQEQQKEIDELKKQNEEIIRLNQRLLKELENRK